MVDRFLGTRLVLGFVFGALLSIGCGSATPKPHHDGELSAAALAEFTDAPGAPRVAAVDPASRIELAGGERFLALRALIRFRAQDDAVMHCAIYALEQTDGGLAEGRRTIACDAAPDSGQVTLVPVEDARVPQLAVALEGARASGASADGAPDGVSDVHVWLTTDRRVVDGDAAPVRWPTPAEEGTEVALGRSPENLSEIWEAVMYPNRYR